MIEQSPNPANLNPARELDAIFAAAQNPDLQPPVDVEQFRVKEPLGQRARRLGNSAIHGRNTIKRTDMGVRIDTTKPDRYNAAGYTDNVANALNELIVETGEFPEGLYDVATSAAVVANKERDKGRDFRNYPEAVESVGLLKAIVRRPEFIKSRRAEEVLSMLGNASYAVCGGEYEGMFTKSIDAGYSYMRPGFDVSAVADLQRIGTSETMWNEAAGRDTKWPLVGTARALATLSKRHPVATQQARLDMLNKNAAGRQMAEVDRALVYTFTSEEDKAFIAEVAGQEQFDAEPTFVASRIVNGVYENMRWAI